MPYVDSYEAGITAGDQFLAPEYLKLIVMQQELFLGINSSPEYRKLTVMEQEFLLGINSSPEYLQLTVMEQVLLLRTSNMPQLSYQNTVAIKRGRGRGQFSH